jgi:hypothetical protein
VKNGCITDRIAGCVDHCRAGRESACGPKDRCLLRLPPHLHRPGCEASAVQPVRTHRNGSRVELLGHLRRSVRVRRRGTAHPASSGENRIRGRRHRPPPRTYGVPDPRQPLRRHRQVRRGRHRRGGPAVVTGSTGEGGLGHSAAGRARGSRSATRIREEVPQCFLCPGWGVGADPSRIDRARSGSGMATPGGDGRHGLPERSAR